MKYLTKKSYVIAAIVLAMLTSGINAQQDASNDVKKQEISANLLDLVIAGTLNFNYERYFSNNQSLWLSVNLFDTYGYYDAGYIDDNSAFSFQASYLIYFSSKKNHDGFFFYPMAKYRFGDITTDDGYYFFEDDATLTSDFSNTYEIDGFSIGFGLGYKWLFNNKLSLMVNGQIARNMSDFDDDYLSTVEPRFGVSFGYRF